MIIIQFKSKKIKPLSWVSLNICWGYWVILYIYIGNTIGLIWGGLISYLNELRLSSHYLLDDSAASYSIPDFLFAAFSGFLTLLEIQNSYSEAIEKCTSD